MHTITEIKATARRLLLASLLLTGLYRPVKAQLTTVKLPNAMMKRGSVGQAYRSGEPVLIQNTNGIDWDKGTVLAVHDTNCKVHYFGKSDSYDEEVELKRVRRPKRYRVGEAVKAQDRYRQWYNATIRSQTGDLYRVRYEGRQDEEPDAVDQVHLKPLSVN